MQTTAPPPARRSADPFDYGAAWDLRGAPRRLGRQVKVHLEDAGGRVCDAWVEDRSVGGLGLSVRRELEPGQLLRIRPAHVSATTPWVEIEVRNCRPVEDRFHVGCQFVRTPPWDVMLLYG